MATGRPVQPPGQLRLSTKQTLLQLAICWRQFSSISASTSLSQQQLQQQLHTHGGAGCPQLHPAEAASTSQLVLVAVGTTAGETASAAPQELHLLL